MSASGRLIHFGAGAAASLALSACLISEEPLLDQRTGRATPFEPGSYRACEIEKDHEPDCRTAAISRDETRLYRFAVGGEDDVTFMRFRRLAKSAWLAQIYGEDDEDYFYFLAEREGEDIALTMVVCEGVAENVRERYVARGEMEVDDNATTCTAKSLSAVMASAQAFRDAGKPGADGKMVYTRLAEEDI